MRGKPETLFLLPFFPPEFEQAHGNKGQYHNHSAAEKAAAKKSPKQAFKL
jgi:hypothetical protein